MRGERASAPIAGEVAEPQLRAEASGEVLLLALIDQGARDVGPVVEARIDALDAIEGVDVVVLDVDHEEPGADPLDDAIVDVTHADVEPGNAALGSEVNLDLVVAPVGFVIGLVPVE